jgi:hypothetical protein
VENIGEVEEVLVKLAEQLELDAEELRRALTQREFEEHVVADERASGSPWACMPVPAFVANRRAALSGVQPTSALAALLAPSNLNPCAVVERRIKRPSTLRRQVQQIPDWIQLVDAALFDVFRQPRMNAVEVTHRSISCP